MLDGLLALGGFRTFADLRTMSRDDRRITLIVELSNRTNQTSTHYQAMDDALLGGAGHHSSSCGPSAWRTPARLIEEPSFSRSPDNVKIDVGDDGEVRYSLYFNVDSSRSARSTSPRCRDASCVYLYAGEQTA